VELYLEDQKIRFEIHAAAVAGARLIASSKILRLSRPRGAGGGG